MNHPCPNTVPCFDPANPLANYSSEIPELFLYDSFQFPIYNPADPIGNDPAYFTAPSCLSDCQSTVSQLDADLCAAREAFICAHTPPGGAAPTFFYSNAQTCTLVCPDNTPFTYTLPAGAVVAMSQSAADQQAAALACLEASRLLACMSSLPMHTICAYQAADMRVSILGSGNGPWTFQITGGGLPPGMSMTANADGRSVQLTGTPTEGGNVSFQVTASNDQGTIIQKTYTLNVLWVSNPPQMPSGTLNAFYSYQFTASGGVPPYTFVLSVPQQDPPLPCASGGFTTAGLFTCTPNQNGSYNLDVTVTDSLGTSCTKAFNWQIGYCNTPQSGSMACPGNPQWFVNYTVPQGAFCSGNQNQADALAQQSLVNNLNSQLAGLGCTCKLTAGTNGAGNGTQVTATVCNYCFELVANGNLIAPPNMLCCGAGSTLDFDGTYYSLTGNHLPPGTLAIPTNFTGPAIIVGW
jgi:hypothetical protein